MRLRATVISISGSLLLLTACGSQQAAAPSTVTVPTTIVKTSLVEVTYTREPSVITTVTMPPVTVTATAPSAAASSSDPSAPKANGNYLVNKQITPGNWQCSSGDDSTFWRISDSSAKTINNGFSTIASVEGSAFTAHLLKCKGTWNLVNSLP